MATSTVVLNLKNIPTRHLIDLTGFTCASGYVTLAFLARQAGEPGLLPFYATVALTALPVFALFAIVVHRDEDFPVSRLLVWALAFRLIGLIGGPFYEDDFFRYLWDGYRFASTGSPYGVAPEAFFLDQTVPSRMRTVLDQINHPDLKTIYGPTTQLLFLLGYWIYPGSVAALQSLLIAIDLATVVLLLRIATPRNVLLYAWCPLVIKEIAFTAHPDVLGVSLVLAAIVLMSMHRARTAAVCLGLAVGAKIFALVMVPLVLVRAKPIHWCYFATTVALLYAPFVVMGDTELDSLIVFATEWEFNSSIFALFTLVLPGTNAKLLLAAICGVLWIGYYLQHRRKPADVPRGDWIYGVLFSVSPVINSWYLIWLLPFAAVYASRWAWTASVALLLSYVTGLNLNDYSLQAYGHPWWVRPLEFGLIGIALIWDLMRRKPETHIENSC